MLAAEPLLQDLQSGLLAILRERLVGLYLYGSLVCGDFDPDISDIDLLAVIESEFSETEFRRLEAFHLRLMERFPNRGERVEIGYVARAILRSFKRGTGSIAMISPGEPFHRKKAGTDWWLNWYIVREKGRILYGPDPRELIEPISKAEFIEAVKRQASEWRDWVSQTRSSRPYQGYAILTMCRALYACANGEEASKRQAAEWAMRELPEHAGQIRAALQWRKEYRRRDIDHEATYPVTAKLVNEIIDRIERLRS